MYDTPRSDSAQPCVQGSGSAQRKSQTMPTSGTSHGRRYSRIWCFDRSDGDRPPWTCACERVLPVVAAAAPPRRDASAAAAVPRRVLRPARVRRGRRTFFEGASRRGPRTQKILSSTTAATGRQLKTSLNCFQTLRPYLRRGGLNFHVAAAATRRHEISTSRPRGRRDPTSTEFPRRRRGVAATRLE